MLVYLDDIRLNAVCEGPPTAPPVVLIHGLGADLTVWDGAVAQLAQWRVLRVDLRGHGGSDVPPPPYAMGALIRDCERIMAHFGVAEAVIAGLGAGGLVAQGLAVKRLDLVRGLVLSNTGTRLGTPDLWQRRIATVQDGGIAAILDATLAQNLGHRWRQAATLDAQRALLSQTDPAGWTGVATAIAGSDFYQTTATLRLPTLVIAASDDAATPPDMQRELAGLIPGAEFRLIQRAGHVAPLDRPEDFAGHLRGFLTRIGHL
ncbi:MAG: alpha/beta fold hydrolase [Tabrizicola sp.]|uniref:alpha/beta fold hydrolase n=1 Tax=Tabrizicola sp. TaxID=2005166 RepID=UPI002735C83C|nr:alpha/beta fold hydrolase [Tabrizicola sp.]MDP3263053.1 alpha/beta fold hydrolase [Tabrizicola sp.]MDP3648588.1 alpha/beta fold hydrolase [Paracoccaceae bacterium]MDZ4068868.1 alpha/beta fold hydrolase [Tabrizicola sp.]